MSKAVVQLPYHIHTLYLFTANDFATFAIPTTLFAIFASLSGSPLTTNPSPSLLFTLVRIPLALAAIWTNLLLFNISNQRSPVAIEEDCVNKPHRPLPARRLNSEDARRLLLYTAPLVMLLGWIMDIWHETLLLMAFTWMYNDLGGSDEHWVLRNALIAIGYGLYSSAALCVIAGPTFDVGEKGLEWMGVVTGVMFVTQHICDIKDAEGDRLRGRKSAPIVLGDEWARWSVTVPVLACSVFCPWFFGLGVPAYVATLGMGGLVAFRNLLYRDLKSDKLTWKLWALWTCGLFALPLVSSPGVFTTAWIGVRALVWEVTSMLCAGNECSVTLNLAAASGIAAVIEGRRVFTQAVVGAENGTVTVPEIVIEGVVR